MPPLARPCFPLVTSKGINFPRRRRRLLFSLHCTLLPPFHGSTPKGFLSFSGFTDGRQTRAGVGGREPGEGSRRKEAPMEMGRSQRRPTGEEKKQEREEKEGITAITPRIAPPGSAASRAGRDAELILRGCVTCPERSLPPATRPVRFQRRARLLLLRARTWPALKCSGEGLMAPPRAWSFGVPVGRPTDSRVSSRARQEGESDEPIGLLTGGNNTASPFRKDEANGRRGSELRRSWKAPGEGQQNGTRIDEPK